MRRLLFALFFFALAASPQSAPEGFRWVNYSQDSFNIAVPADWRELDSAATEAVPAMVAALLPRASAMRFRHILGLPPLGINSPWIAILTTDRPIDESQFGNMDFVTRKYDEALQSSIAGTMQVRIGGRLVYDRLHHVLWGKASSSFTGVSNFRDLFGSYLTTTGSVQVHCYSRAPDFARNEPICRRIIESVGIDPKIALPAVPSSPATDAPPTGYESFVRHVEAGDFVIDFRAFRLACMQSDQCQPRATKTDLGTLHDALENHEFAKAAEVAERMIHQGFVNIEVHADSVAAYQALHDDAKAKFHLRVTAALMSSILTSGDGTTEKTAYEVISDREEYLTLTAKRLPYNGVGVTTSEIEEGGHHYTRWQIADPKTGQLTTVFFNTDAFTSKSVVGAN